MKQTKKWIIALSCAGALTIVTPLFANAAGNATTNNEATATQKMHMMREARLLENEALLKALGMTKTELQKELSAGKSLRDIVEAKGISHDTIRTIMKAEKQQRMLEDTALLKKLDMTKAELKKELESGKDLREIAEAKGVSQDELHQLREAQHQKEALENKELLKALNMTKAELQKEFSAGKSLRDVMKEKNLLPERKEGKGMGEHGNRGGHGKGMHGEGMRKDF